MCHLLGCDERPGRWWRMVCPYSATAAQRRPRLTNALCVVLRCLLTSAHHFCFECYESWASCKPSCPTCRAPVWAITRDVEFATLIGARCSTVNTVKERGEADDEESAGGAARRVAVRAPAGLTIANKGHGCVVTRVVRHNGAYAAGIRAGDTILAVNGTTVRDHQQCIEFIEKRCRVGDCELEVKPTLTAGKLVCKSVGAPGALLSRLTRRASPGRPRGS